MLLRKYMSLLGIGAAQIDLVLPKTTYRIGEYIEGQYIIKGGTVEQHIKRIECDLIQFQMSNNKEKVMDVSTHLISEIIKPEETLILSFYFTLPVDLKVSAHDRHYRFHTKLYFNEGVESKDQDIIRIIS